MALREIIVPKKYKNGRTLSEPQLDKWRLSVIEHLQYINLNLTQLRKDCFLPSYDYDNDGSGNLSRSLQSQINLLSAGGVPLSGTSSASFIINTGANALTLSTSLLTADREVLFPDVDGTVCILDATQTLTNKTFGASTFTENSSLSASSDGSAVSWSISNTSNTASSDAKQVIDVAGSSAGNAFTTWSNSGSSNYWSMGLYNPSSTDPLEIQKASTLSGDYLAKFNQLGSGGQNYLEIYNSNNTASSDAYIMAQVGGSSAGDPMIQLNVQSATTWTIGIDNSDGDVFKIDKSSSVSASDFLIQSNKNGAGGDNYWWVRNADNTNSGSRCYFQTSVGGASSGDPMFVWTVEGVTTWTAAIDNSDSDNFKIGTGSTVGTNTYFQIDTNGRVYLTPGTTQGLQITSADSDAIYSVVTKSSASSVLGHTLGISNPSTSGSASATALSVYSIAAGSGISYGLRVSVNGGTNNYAFDLSLSSSHAAGFSLAKFDTSQGTTAALGAYVGKMPFLHGSSTYYFPFYA